MVSSFIDLPHRAVLSLTGPDTIVLLERLVTNATDDWAPGEARYGALLTPQGKVLSDYLALRISDGVLLDVSIDFIDDLAKRLKLFRLRSQVEINRRDDLSVVAALEPASDDSPAVPDVEHVYLDSRYAEGRWRALVSKPVHNDAQDIDAYHADRIRHCVPEQGFDFGSAEIFPADINMDILGGVALNKGCFVGQEVVSRMHRRGQIRKRTLTFSTDPDSHVETGSDLVASAPVGSVTSYVSGQGLARMRVDRLLKAEAAGSGVTIDESPVRITKPDWLLREQDAMNSA